MNIREYIENIEQQRKEQDAIYHNVVLEMILGTRNRKKIILTDRGKELAARTMGLLREAENRAYARLSEKELDTYLEMTTKLTVSLREETEKL